jgi:hypothetical protein
VGKRWDLEENKFTAPLQLICKFDIYTHKIVQMKNILTFSSLFIALFLISCKKKSNNSSTFVPVSKYEGSFEGTSSCGKPFAIGFYNGDIVNDFFTHSGNNYDTFKENVTIVDDTHLLLRDTTFITQSGSVYSVKGNGIVNGDTMTFTIITMGAENDTCILYGRFYPYATL